MRLTGLSIILALLIAFFLLTTASPNLLLVVLFLTLGLGLPLLALNTALLYYAAAFPALVLLGNRPRPWRTIAFAACVVPAVALFPPALSQFAASISMRQYFVDDIEARLSETPKSIEITGIREAYGGPDDALKNAPCDKLCQNLLLSKKVNVVRVTRSSENGRARSQLDYVIEQRRNCPNAFGEGETLLPATKDALVSGTCFIARASDATAMTARIERRKSSTSDPQNLAEDLAAVAGAVREIQLLEISTADAAGWSRRLRQTQVKYTHWAMPLYVWYAPCHGMCMGRPVFGRTERILNPFVLDALALQTLDAEPSEPTDRLSPAARVMAMLDGAGEALTANQTQLVREWSNSMPCAYQACPPIAGLDEQVAMRLVKDRRVTDFVFIGNVFQRNRRLVADNLDLFLNEMEGRGANSQFSNVIGAIIPLLDNAIVRDRRDRILALVEANEWTWSRGIGIVAGRLGIDTTALITERLGRKTSAQTAALAACIADEAVGRALVPSLLAHLRALPVSDRFPDYADRDAVKALARFGHFEEAKEIYLSRFPKSGEHSLPRQSAEAVVNDVNACYRG